MKREKMTPKELVKELKKGATIILEDEETRLKRIGAEIMGWKRYGRGWSPATDLNHTAMVIEELKVKRSLWLSLRQISCKEAPWEAWFTFGGMAGGYRRTLVKPKADTIGKAIMLAAEKVWKVEKGE